MSIKPKLLSGSQFKELRVSKKITMYKLVQLTGLNRRTIEQFEREETSPLISTYATLMNAVENYKADDHANG
jgi:transcriptional regulator with XRE-family HTH domain